jgi:hypothetical protein
MPDIAFRVTRNVVRRRPASWQPRPNRPHKQVEIYSLRPKKNDVLGFKICPKKNDGLLNLASLHVYVGMQQSIGT